jgi:hypothetical protein
MAEILEQLIPNFQGGESEAYFAAEKFASHFLYVPEFGQVFTFRIRLQKNFANYLRWAAVTVIA